MQVMRTTQEQIEKAYTEPNKPSNGFQKADLTKTDLSFLPLHLLEGTAKTFQKGFQSGKYERNNFYKCEDPLIPFASLMRHLRDWQTGYRTGDKSFITDKESGLNNLHHAIANLLIMLAVAEKTGDL